MLAKLQSSEKQKEKPRLRETAKVRLPLRAKITLPFLLIAILIAFSAVYLAGRVASDSVEQRFTNQLVENTRLSQDWMVAEENRLLDLNRQLAYTQGLAEALQLKDADTLRALAFGTTLANFNESVDFIDTSGERILTMRHNPGAVPEEYLFLTGGGPFFLQWEFVQQAIQPSDTIQGIRYSGLALADWGGYFYVAGPVYTPTGEKVGAVLVGTTLETLAAKLSAATNSTISFYSAEGQSLASVYANPQNIAVDLAPKEIAQQMQGSVRRNLVNRQIRDQEKKNFVEVLSPWMANGDQPMGILGVSLPAASGIYASSLTLIQGIAIAVVLFVLIILVGLSLSSSISRPILGMANASREVASGNLKVEAQAPANDEVAVLADSFNLMVQNMQKSKTDLVKALDGSLESWAKALELRDKETEGHTQRVTELTVMLARRLGVPEEDIIHIRRGAILHDIGKMAIPDSILLKPGALTEEEWRLMRRHPEYARDLLWQVEYLRPALEIPYCHHERWDGSGYPRKLKGEQIPVPARIFAVVDVWDSLTSDRPYRPAMPREVAFNKMVDNKGAQFDPRMVDLLVSVLHRTRASAESHA